MWICLLRLCARPLPVTSSSEWCLVTSSLTLQLFILFPASNWHWTKIFDSNHWVQLVQYFKCSFCTVICGLHFRVTLHGKFICIELVFGVGVWDGYLECYPLASMVRGWAPGGVPKCTLPFHILGEPSLPVQSRAVICSAIQQISAANELDKKWILASVMIQFPRVFSAVSHLKITGFTDKAGGRIWHQCKDAGICSLLYCCNDRRAFLP